MSVPLGFFALKFITLSISGNTVCSKINSAIFLLGTSLPFSVLSKYFLSVRFNPNVLTNVIVDLSDIVGNKAVIFLKLICCPNTVNGFDNAPWSAWCMPTLTNSWSTSPSEVIPLSLYNFLASSFSAVKPKWVTLNLSLKLYTGKSIPSSNNCNQNEFLEKDNFLRFSLKSGLFLISLALSVINLNAVKP